MTSLIRQTAIATPIGVLCLPLWGAPINWRSALAVLCVNIAIVAVLSCITVTINKSPAAPDKD